MTDTCRCGGIGRCRRHPGPTPHERNLMTTADDSDAIVAQLATEHTIARGDAQELARFTTPNFSVQDRRQDPVEALRRKFFDAALALIRTTPPTKSRAVALTELETAMMWAVKAYFGAPGE